MPSVSNTDTMIATKIICRAIDCIFNENKVCTSEEIVYDPEDGCLTYEAVDDLVSLVEDDEDWDEAELLDEEDDDDLIWDDDDLLMDDEDFDDLDLDEEDDWA